MTTIFDIEEDVTIQEAQDFDGKRTVETNIYQGKIKLAYLDKSKKSANSVNLLLELNGKVVNFTEYVTSGTDKGCKNYYIDSKTQKKMLLPGMQAMNELAQVVTGVTIAKQDMEEKVIKIFDYDLKKEAPVKRMVLTSLNNQPITVAIQEIRENKYSDPTQAIFKNTILKVLHADTQTTLAEHNKGKTVATWAPKWLEKNADLLKDTFKEPEKAEGTEANFDVTTDTNPDEDIFAK